MPEKCNWPKWLVVQTRTHAKQLSLTDNTKTSQLTENRPDTIYSGGSDSVQGKEKEINQHPT